MTFLPSWVTPIDLLEADDNLWLLVLCYVHFYLRYTVPLAFILHSINYDYRGGGGHLDLCGFPIMQM